MKNYVRTTLSALLLTAILTGSYWVISPRNAQAETADSKIPAYVKGRQFTIDLNSGARLTSVTVVDVIQMNNEPWWRVALPAASGNAGVVYYTVNPRQIQMLENLP